MVMGAVVFGITMMAWSVSADREHRDKMPEVRYRGEKEGAYDTGLTAGQPGRFFPSRFWSREIREHEKAQKAQS